MQEKFKCGWCGEKLDYDMLDLDEHDVPRWCPECGYDARKDWYNKYKKDIQNDAVNHPGHYTFGEIEVIDYIRDKLEPVAFQGYCTGNVLKYVSRYRHKNGVEDLKKAQVYLGWLIESLEKETEE